jgi:SAM-dependent methyltransferase
MQKYGPVHRHQRRIYHFLLKLIQDRKPKSVLDIGCGSGDNLCFIKRLFPSIKVFGIDITDVPLKIARQVIPNGTFWTDDIQELKAPRETYDIVTFFEVIEHLQNDSIALSNIYKLTNKYLLLSTVGGMMREVEREIGHYRNYQLEQLNDMLGAVGFRVIKTVQWGFPFYSPIFRAIAANPHVVTFSYGRYGFHQRTACQLLYYLFFLNSWNKGDKIMILAEKI